MRNYGYKICYREEGEKRYVRHFLTHTRKDAVNMIRFYIRCPPHSRDDRHMLINPKWKIIPVTLREVNAGIWNKPPF